jgi:hypothetical protein
VALALPQGPVTARQLIKAAVIAEVTAYENLAAQASMVRMLTDKSLLADLEQGAVRMGDVPPAGPVDRAATVDAALLAFDDGLFKVFVGDDELAADSSPAELADGSSVLFLRLVPLAGG